MFAMTDIVNALQLQNRGKPTKALITAAQVPFYGNYVIRKDLFDQGIDSLEKFVEWKRPDGSKPIIGISTIGGSIYTLGTFIFENLGAADKVNWVALGTNAGMLGALASRQVDLIPAAYSALYDSVQNGWGEPVLDVTKPEDVAKYIGGDFPGLSFFTLDSSVQGQPDIVQAYVNAHYRGMQWLKDASVDEIHERFVNKYIQGLSPEGSRREIEYMKMIWNYGCQTDRTVYENGGRIWYREATGIQPIAYEDVVAPQFVDNAAKKYG